MLPDKLSRRHFLATSAAGIACAATAPRLDAAQQQDRFRGWPVGIQSYSLRKYDRAQAIRHMQGLGLHFVEFYSKHVPLDSSTNQLAELNKLLGQSGIKMSSHGVNRFTKDHEKNRTVFEFAKRAGLKNITCNPTTDSFDSLDKLVAEYDIRVAIHNHGPGSSYDKIQEVVDAVKDHDPRIGACVDTGHFIRSKEDPIEAVKKLGKRVFGLHIKDEGKTGKEVSQRDHRQRIPRLGSVVLRRSAKSAFPGMVRFRWNTRLIPTIQSTISSSVCPQPRKRLAKREQRSRSSSVVRICDSRYTQAVGPWWQ